MSKKQKKNTKYSPKKFMALIAAVVMISAVVSVVITAKIGENRAAYFLRGAFTSGGEVVDGTLDIEGLSNLKDIPKGEIRYFLNKQATFSDGYAKGSILLLNPEQCDYALQFYFYLADGSGAAPIYKSDLIKPGQYLNGDKLACYLRAGTYDCTYTVRAFDMKTNEEVGTLNGLLTINILH